MWPFPKSTVSEKNNLVKLFNDALTVISKKQFAGSLNYETAFTFIKCPNAAGQSLDSVVQKALGDKASIGGSNQISSDQLVSDFYDKVSHPGDHGSHPNMNYMEGSSFKDDLSSASVYLKTFLDDASLIISFRIKDGHPFYPVFWDFSFMIESGDDSYLFIGSSSD